MSPTPDDAAAPSREQNTRRALGLIDKWIAADPNRPVTVPAFKALVEAFLKRVGDLEIFVAEMNTNNSTRNAKIATIENDTMRFRGVWKEGAAYGMGAVVVRSGGLWFAERATASPPGKADGGWRLVVKSGSFSEENER
jgi:hypothetical protein